MNAHAPTSRERIAYLGILLAVVLLALAYGKLEGSTVAQFAAAIVFVVACTGIVAHASAMLGTYAKHLSMMKGSKAILDGLRDATAALMPNANPTESPHSQVSASRRRTTKSSR